MCLSFTTILVNCYSRGLICILLIDGETILSQEGTSQGDPLSMLFYAISMLPLIDCLQSEATQLSFMYL